MQMYEGLAICPNSGVVVPKRIFVGGIPYGCTSNELKQFFSSFGFVVHSKIIKDNEGLSKGYGFISFESKCDAQNVLRMGTVFFREKKLKIRPAIRRLSEKNNVRRKENLEDIYMASNGMHSSWNNAAMYSEYPSMLTYDANMQSPYPLTSTLHIGSPHCPKIKLLNNPNSCAASGCSLMSHNANECCAVANTVSLPQSTILRRDPYNLECPYISGLAPYKP